MEKRFEFGKILKELRDEKDISQSTLASMLFVSQDTVSLWERNKSLPDFNSVKKLAVIFDVSADILLGLKD